MSAPDYNVYDRMCPARQALDRVADRWTALIVGQLETGPRRFSELLASISGISQKMLTQTLRKLERDGLVNRQVKSSTIPISVIYSLTEAGQALTQPLADLRVWAEEHARDIISAQIMYDKATAKTAQSTRSHK